MKFNRFSFWFDLGCSYSTTKKHLVRGAFLLISLRVKLCWLCQQFFTYTYKIIALNLSYFEKTAIAFLTSFFIACIAAYSTSCK